MSETKIDNVGDPTAFHKGKTLKKTPIQIAIISAVFLIVIVLWVISTKGQPSEQNQQTDIPAQEASAKKQGAALPPPEILKEPTGGKAAIPSEDEKKDDEKKAGLKPTTDSFYHQPPPQKETPVDKTKQMLAELRIKKLYEAMNADTVIKVNDTSVTQQQPTSSSEQFINQMVSQAGLRAQQLQANLQGEVIPQNVDQNKQEDKLKFTTQANSDGYLSHTRTAPVSQFELNAGTIIPATLISGMNSDLPGKLIAQVSQNVYDSATGNYLLIPQGTKLFGTYDSKVSFGQNRGLTVWSRLNFPDGSRLNIESMGGIDKSGYSGFEDEVDHHYFKTFGNAAILGLISGGVQSGVSEPENQSRESAISDGVTQQFAQTGSSLIQKNLDVQPTIKIRPGYKFNVMVSKDIILSPYTFSK